MVMGMMLMLPGWDDASSCSRDWYNRLLTAAGFCDKGL